MRGGFNGYCVNEGFPAAVQVRENDRPAPRKILRSLPAAAG